MNKKSKNFLITLLLIHTFHHVICSDIRDYFPKKDATLDKIELFRSINLLKRTVKKELSQRIIITANLAEACLKIDTQNKKIESQQIQIDNLQTSIQLLTRNHDDNSLNINILKHDVDTINNDIIEHTDAHDVMRNDIAQLEEKILELSDFDQEIITMRGDIDDIEEDIKTLNDVLENIKTQIAESSDSKENLNNRIDELHDMIDEVGSAITKKSPKKHPRSPEVPFGSVKRMK